MFIIKTKKIDKRVLKAVVGFNKFLNSCTIVDMDNMEFLYNEMVALYGASSCTVVGFDISSNQYYILMLMGEDFVFGCLTEDGCLRRITEKDTPESISITSKARPFEDTEFEDEDDGIPQVDEIDHE